MVTYEDIKNNEEIKAYIMKADEALVTMGFTEHSFAHVTRCAQKASEFLSKLGYSQRECELAKIAGYMHDIGNVINRTNHALSGAVMTFRLLDHTGMDPLELSTIISAIGNHDESTAVAVNPVSAALILADKSDVRRSRVRNQDFVTFDIHDRVNYAVEESDISLSEDLSIITLKLKIDTNICAVMDYFEIFLGRMLLCKRAAEYLKIKFDLVINNTKLM